MLFSVNLHVFCRQIASLDDAKVERSVSGHDQPHVTEDLQDLELLRETSWSTEAQVRRRTEDTEIKTSSKRAIHAMITIQKQAIIA